MCDDFCICVYVFKCFYRRLKVLGLQYKYKGEFIFNVNIESLILFINDDVMIFFLKGIEFEKYYIICYEKNWEF